MEAPKNGSKISYVDMANAPRVDCGEVNYSEEGNMNLTGTSGVSSGFYFHQLFQANVPVTDVQPVRRGNVRVTLPNGTRRIVNAAYVSPRPVDGFPTRATI